MNIENAILKLEERLNESDQRIKALEQYIKELQNTLIAFNKENYYFRYDIFENLETKVGDLETRVTTLEEYI